MSCGQGGVSRTLARGLLGFCCMLCMLELRGITDGPSTPEVLYAYYAAYFEVHTVLEALACKITECGFVEKAISRLSCPISYISFSLWIWVSLRTSSSLSYPHTI
jgi:hypothetical protein